MDLTVLDPDGLVWITRPHDPGAAARAEILDDAV